MKQSYTIKQFVELFNDEHYNQLWSKYNFDDDTYYDLEEVRLETRKEPVKDTESLTFSQPNNDVTFTLNKLVKMFNHRCWFNTPLEDYYPGYDKEHHIKLYKSN